MIRPQRRFHAGRQGAAEGHATGEVQFHQAVPVFIANLVDRLRQVVPGIVDQDIDLAQGPTPPR